MTLLRLRFPLAVPLFLSLLTLTILSFTGCETTEPKKSAALPAHASAPEVTAPVAPKADPQPKIQEDPKPQADPAEALIASAEKQYAAGQANYQAGHLEAAKTNFDQAFDTLLSSNLDVRNDERLEREFDKIVEAVHELEMAALQQGDGFTEPRSEPAPIDEANDITFPVDPNIRAKAEAEIKTTKSDLPLVLNDQVAMFINYFSNPRGRATLEHAWARAGRYHDMISRTLKEVGVPQDLIYLAQAESGFQPLALSRAGARGMWQFMAGAAEIYGLERSWWVDERQDPEKATLAAARHLKDLYNQFGDWYLAMAAYNSGASTVQHAVERTGYADFWELYRRGVLPQETRNYVPIILAETIMAKNPEQYGLQPVAPDPPPQTDQVTINYPVDLRLVAECLDTSVDYLQELNPSLLRMTTPKDQSFTLKLPAGSQEKYETAVAVIPLDMRTYWRYHRVEYGDTLPSIARKYHTSASSIAEANNLPDDEVKAGTKLIIPVAPGRHDTQTVAYSHRATHYKVRKGDTMASVADDFEVPVEKVRKWNHLRGSALTPGRTLVIYKPTGPESDHKIKKGETLSSIAESNHTSVAALKRDNPKLAANLRAGDLLLIRK
ncbi:MAG: LysM peptidoglycan-binding domain-containing protein [Candidatus Korobacteraceae bacterium]